MTKQQTLTPKTAIAAAATDDAKLQMAAKAIDTDSDGQISAAEYITYSESVYAKLKKGISGQVDLKDMANGISALGQEPTTHVAPERQPATAAAPRQQISATPLLKQQSASSTVAATPQQQAASAGAMAATKAAAGVSASGETDHSLQVQMKSMDTDGDGLVSRTEYMNYYESSFAKMKKNSVGMIDLKEIG